MAIAGSGGWTPSYSVSLLRGHGVHAGTGINVPNETLKSVDEALEILANGQTCYVSQFEFIELRRRLAQAGLPSLVV